MGMDRLRIGVIGLGWFGEIHCETIVGIPNMELAALCTRTPERLAQQAEKFGVAKTYRDYRDMLADRDIDAVSICTMWDQHTDPTIAALEAGKHVFLEKPMASTVADCDRILAAARKAKGVLQIGHIVRFNPRYRMAKQAIDAGKIGKIVALSSRRNIPAAWTPEILNKIGPIVGDAIHDTDIMLWFTGDTVASAYAQTVSVRNLKFPDIGQTMYRFKGGATATLETVWCMPEKTPFDIDERMSIIGTEGIIHVQDTFPNLGIVSADKLHSPDTTYWPMFDGVRGGALREELAYFANCALKGETPAIGRPEDAAAALAATLAAEESARTGKVVHLN
jgi:predicted dehydrogenase